MSLVSWMYISRSLLSPVRADDELGRIVQSAHARNQDHRMTGTLLFTGTRFAQYLEGPVEHKAEMRGLIHGDPRHTDVVTIDERPRTRRRCGGWSLAFVGSSSHYVAKAVERPLQVGPDGRREGIEALQRLMIEFASQAQP